MKKITIFSTLLSVLLIFMFIAHGFLFASKTTTDNKSVETILSVESQLDDEDKEIVISTSTSVVTSLVTGNIDTTLFEAVEVSGERLKLAAMIASIYEWELDFFRDIAVGDRFTVLVEKIYEDEKFIGYGKILASEFVNRGKKLIAIYYQDGNLNGYFNESGKAYERGFLKVPLNFTRISSRFTNSRLHPVYYEYMPHHGVDYAAPTGTPVYATANGVIEKMEYGSNGNGNFVVIDHQNGYKTFYLHLSGYHKSLYPGAYVKRGQTIAYVGNTGASTAPHLDYRVNFNGQWLDPLKMKVVNAKSIPEYKMGRFKEYSEVNIALLNSLTHLYATYGLK